MYSHEYATSDDNCDVISKQLGLIKLVQHMKMSPDRLLSVAKEKTRVQAIVMGVYVLRRDVLVCCQEGQSDELVV